ncbi:MAG: HAD family phosphatase [Nigerium sp.]|nr:HAD family phosphatase [Nigerium sp.]
MKAAFLDYDGTFAAPSGVPPEHVEAVHAAQSAGHRVFLCTGRPRPLITDALVSLFDGVIGLAGGYIELDGRVLTDTVFSPELAATTVSVLDEHGVHYTLEASDGLYASAPGLDALRAIGGLVGPTFSDFPIILRTLRVSDMTPPPPFGKVVCWQAPMATRDLAGRIGPDVTGLPSSLPWHDGHAGEIFLAAVTKAVGMRTVTERLGLTLADAVAVGDGHNDIEMLQEAGTAVAIAGAPAALLAHADHVVPGPERAGIVAAFELAGLFDRA